MKKIGKFSGMTSKKEEIIKKFAETEKAIPLLQKEIARLRDRLSAAETIAGVVLTEEKSQIKLFQERLAEESDATTVSDGIGKIQQKNFEKENEIAGLRVLIEKKESELEPLQKQLRERNFLLAQSEYFSYFDRYNEQAAALSETIKDILRAQISYESAANEAGINATRYVSAYDNRGIPEMIPAILPEYSVDDFDSRYHWHYHQFQQMVQDLQRATNL